MRWKLYGDVREDPYKCCWFIHVRTGAVLLGIYSLVNQVCGLLLASYILAHPNVVPQWLSSFEVSRVGVLQKGMSICDQTDHSGLRFKRHAGGMMDHMPMMNTSLMHGHMMHGPMMHGPMMHGEVLPDGSQGGKEMPANGEDGKVLPKVSDLMLGGEMMPEMGDPMPQVRHDSIGVQLADVLTNPDRKVSASLGHNDDGDDDDARDLIIPIGSQARDMSHLHRHVNSPALHYTGFTADDKFFMYAMLISCIAASLLLIVGVVKGRPGHMIPYMGLQAFDFCASALFVFALFSYLPYLRNWLLSLPDSFPMKCDLLAMKTDRLMLCVILTAVFILVTKAYLMGVVWSCYKYLTQANESRARHRSLDSDAASSPDDVQLLLPPKYEDIAAMATSSDDVESAPPAYTSH